MHLIIYGPEGSGKGTQAKHLSEYLNLPIYTSGDLVRNAARNDQGRIGATCREALSQGRYVADDDMFVLWQDKLESRKAKKGFILDGFPRNVPQAKFLFKTIKKNNYFIDKIIFLNINDEEAKKRLIKRNRKLFEGSQISHDTTERITERLKIYHVQEKELLHFFDGFNLLLEINGEQKENKVFADIVKKVKKLKDQNKTVIKINP